MDMGRPVEVKSFSVSAEGSFEFFDENSDSIEPVKTTLERGYERVKGLKVLSRMPISSRGPLSSDPNLALQKYDTIFAIDANTKSIRGTEVSVAAIVLGKWTERLPTLKLGFSPMWALEFHNVDCHPDLLALKHIVLQMESDPRRVQAGRVALIIDSNLRDLESIVSRQTPILDDCYFPSWADLIFASDAAQDSVCNLLLRQSDRAANNLLRQIEANLSPAISQTESPEHASYFRLWHFGKKSLHPSG